MSIDNIVLIICVVGSSLITQNFFILYYLISFKYSLKKDGDSK